MLSKFMDPINNMWNERDGREQYGIDGEGGIEKKDKASATERCVIIVILYIKVKAGPVLMYGSENWSLNQSDRRKIEAAETRFLRPVAGYTLGIKKK